MLKFAQNEVAKFLVWTCIDSNRIINDTRKFITSELLFENYIYYIKSKDNNDTKFQLTETKSY